MNAQAQRNIIHKLKVFEHARLSHSVAFTCRYYGISRDTFYRWKKQYTAIDDATRIRARQIYEKHTQQNAIDFIN